MIAYWQQQIENAKAALPHALAVASGSTSSGSGSTSVAYHTPDELYQQIKTYEREIARLKHGGIRTARMVYQHL